VTALRRGAEAADGLQEDDGFDAAFELGDEFVKAAGLARGAEAEDGAGQPHQPRDRRSGVRFEQVLGERRRAGFHARQCTAAASRSD
jgi:hypothetical protein